MSHYVVKFGIHKMKKKYNTDVSFIVHIKYIVRGRSSQCRQREMKYAANVLLLHKCGGALEKNRGQATCSSSTRVISRCQMLPPLVYCSLAGEARLDPMTL